MKYAMAALVTGFALLMAGCGQTPVVSLRPLYNPQEKPVAEPRIEGEWNGYVLSGSGVSPEAQWKISVQPDGCYVAERLMKDAEKRAEKDEKEIYRACLVTLDRKLLFDAELAQKKVGMEMVAARDMMPGMAPAHLLGRVWAQPDFIRMSRLGEGWIKQNVPEELRTTADSSLVLSGSTQQLRDLMAQHAEDNAALGAAWYLCRPGSDCASRVMEDELARRPDNSEVLEGAAWFLVGSGDYQRAVVLLSKRAEVQPVDSGAKYELGMARLFLRDFQGARENFTAGAKQNRENESLAPVIAATYFLEGNYAEAAKILAQAPPSADSASSATIILNYAALSRMGRQKQAESYLSDQMAHFVGKEEDLLQLLRATGRVKDYQPQFTDAELEEGDGVFYALVRLAKGDRQAARQALAETVKRVKPVSPIVLGAKIELERLNASEPKPKQ